VAGEVEFCLLGPLLVRRGGAVVPVPPGKQQALLAALLTSANRVVPLAELTEVLWGSEPPPSARATLRNYVKRLRKALESTGDSRISTLARGYLLRVDAGELDVSRFEAAQLSAREAARGGAWDRAAEQLRAALSLWRGEPLADVPSELLALREVPRLAEMRLQALEARAEADLHLNRHADVIAELRQLAGTHPLRERLHALLMLALYRDGQQGEALAAYQRARRMLIEELGAEPGPELRQLERQILAADPALAAPAPAGMRGAADLARPGPEQRVWAVVPRQLPAAVRYFTGRTAELAALASMPGHAAGTGRTVVICAIAGTAGVGKTALAVQWAHRVADRFPDGQLYVNLRGYDPGQPMAATDALAGFLRAMGVPGQHIPAEAEERAAQYRSLLAGRRMLVVLDNAASVEQVRPLLPGAPGCAVVVTSRDALAGLVARDGARRLDVDLLSLSEAVSLLRALIGDRVDASPEGAEALAIQCARLPLALRMAAELVAARPRELLSGLAGELADRQRRLDLLDAGGDPRTAMRAVFSWSWQYLDPAAARMFRLAGLPPGPDLDCYAAAALTDTTVVRARDLLNLLARAHLIQPACPGRYGMHDLLRAYARELAAARDGEDERRAALTRLFDRYVHTAAAAMDTLYPAESHRRPCAAPPATPAPPVTGPDAARAWLDAERAGLVAVAVHAAGNGWPGHATRLSAILFRYLSAGGHYPEAIIIHTSARSAARQAGDRAAEAAALRNLGAVDLLQARYQQAAGHLQQAVALHRQAGDRTGEAYALETLGCLHLRQGRYQQATGHFERALALHRQAGDQFGEAYAQGNLGCVDLRQGRCRQATDHLRQAVALCRKTGDRAGEAHALADLGDVELQAGRPGQARTQHTTALGLASQAGDKQAQAQAHNGLARCYHATGEYGQAHRHWQQALTLYTGLGAPEADQVCAQLAAADNHGRHET
jgi:DNA-binding SARP family transcriptional activator/Tfp pilus assembly protein PilF